MAQERYTDGRYVNPMSDRCKTRTSTTLYACFAAVLISLYGCNSLDNNECLRYLKFYYLDRDIETIYSLKSEDVIKDELSADTTIFESQFIDFFESEINKLENDTITRGINARVVAEVHDGDSIVLVSFGEHFGTMVNDVRKKDSQTLFEIIEKNLYNKSGYRRLFDKMLKVQCKDMDLSDNEIERRWNWYYKNYVKEKIREQKGVKRQ